MSLLCLNHFAADRETPHANKQPLQGGAFIMGVPFTVTTKDGALLKCYYTSRGGENETGNLEGLQASLLRGMKEMSLTETRISYWLFGDSDK